MNDNDVPATRNGPDTDFTAENGAELRQVCQTSDFARCICCLAAAPGCGLTYDVAFHVRRLALSAFVGPCRADKERRHWRADTAGNNGWAFRRTSRSADIEDCVRNAGHHTAHSAHCAGGHPHSPENTRLRKPRGRRPVTRVPRDCRHGYAHNSYRLQAGARRQRRARFKAAA